MTRRTLLVPLFAAGLILAPSEISGRIGHGAGWKPALPATGSSMEVGSTGLYRWSAQTYREALGPQGRFA